uniref:Cdc23 domain-containing protein n=1 Tax=Acrobeloides nanus TaxID=290746 RepID=A0A914CYX8_9BILA
MMEKSETEPESKKFDYAEIVSDLIWIAEECELRCMFDSTKWIYEILSNLSPLHFDAYEKSKEKASASNSAFSTLSSSDRFIVKHAKELIRDKEYHRAKFFLERFNLRGTYETFLYYWSWYLISLRERQEAEAEGLTRKQEFQDNTLAELRHELEKLKQDKPEIFDCFLNT